MTTELLPDNLINAMTTVFCGQMYDEYGDVEFQHAKRAILVMVDNFNLVERTRPAPSANLLFLAQEIADAVDAPVGTSLSKARSILEAFRQQTWAAARDTVARFVGNTYTYGGIAVPAETRTEIKKAISALTPLERKEAS